MGPRQRLIGVLVAVAAGLIAGQAGLAATVDAGMALRSEPKYRPGFKSFGYANPEAPKGGALIVGTQAEADTRNPYALKGQGAPEVEELVFQTLGVASLDEPFSKYPGLAESFELAADGLSLTVRLRPAATFSDGTPVTAADVVFSLATFRSDKVAPFFKSYWADIKDAAVVGPRTVRFTFAKVNPELALITTELPVLPEHVYAKGDFSDQVVGSGPYTLTAFHPGADLTLSRRPHWWGEELGVFKGRYNFDEIKLKFYKDQTPQIEAFKKGDFDLYSVYSAKVWATDLQGDKFSKLHYIKRDLLPNSNAQGGQGFVFNLRLPQFQDVRVRQALALAFDFDWSNKNLFFGQYQQTESFFQNTPLAAHGLPTPEELEVLEPLKADLPPEVYTKEIGWLGKGKQVRDRMREAQALLQAAGYKVKDGVAEGPAGKLTFRVLLSPGNIQRVMEPYLQNLRKLGVDAAVEEKEQSVYTKRLESREFAMTSVIYGQSQSPGNEQRDYWSSAAADQNYSRNYAGLKNKAVDSLVDRIIYAKTRAELELASRCLDRALYHLHLMVQNWYAPTFRLAYWDKFSYPATLPLYYAQRLFIETMWFDAAKAAKLGEARDKGVPLL